MTDYTIIRKCSTLCTMHEPCSISESGLCAQNNKRPVDHIALAMELATAGAAYANAHPDASMIECMAQALREVMK